MTERALDAAERRLSVVFPSDYRALMQEQDGFTEEAADGTLVLHPLQTVVAINEEASRYVSDTLPGALIFGSDGSRESIVWDIRQAAPPVYLVDLTNARWNEALPQAANLTSLLDQFRSEGGFRWGEAEP